MAHKLPEEMQRAITAHVSELTQSYAQAGDFVLPQTQERIQAAIREERMFVALNQTQTQFIGAAKWAPLLVRPEGLLQVAEIGSLVRAPNTKGYGVPSPVALCVRAIVEELESRGVLGVATARSEKSRNCLTQGGMVEARWEHLPAIAAPPSWYIVEIPTVQSLRIILLGSPNTLCQFSNLAHVIDYRSESRGRSVENLPCTSWGGATLQCRRGRVRRMPGT